MADLTLRQIRKSYGSVDILHGIDLDIRSGEFIVFVGPSGCGKPTLLRSIAGLEEITSDDRVNSMTHGAHLCEGRQANRPIYFGTF